MQVEHGSIVNHQVTNPLLVEIMGEQEEDFAYYHSKVTFSRNPQYYPLYSKWKQHLENLITAPRNAPNTELRDRSVT